MNHNSKSKRELLKNIRTVSEYKEYTANIKLSALERVVMDMIYLDGYDLNYIADTLGYSRSTIAKISQKILKKL